MQPINIDLDSKRVWPTELADQGRPVSFPAISTGTLRRSSPTPNNEESQLLINCREKLGLTQPEMAVRLGMPLSTYHAYEYARVRNVPKDILANVQTMVDRASEEACPFEKYQGMSMVQISDVWAERVDVDPSNVTAFALRLGVNKSTVSRWRSGGQKPSKRNILLYEQVVEKVEAQMKRAGQIESEMQPIELPHKDLF